MNKDAIGNTTQMNLALSLFCSDPSLGYFGYSLAVQFRRLDIAGNGRLRCWDLKTGGHWTGKRAETIQGFRAWSRDLLHVFRAIR